ncbi:hypothetical protein Fmac_003120 [Flemingia macrophylla]|uniref:Uncharacterized protein n=1 Tax=Flemingia macrophylla TaxID=520843 RepID=A0ABD1NLW9_9FABA
MSASLSWCFSRKSKGALVGFEKRSFGHAICTTSQSLSFLDLVTMNEAAETSFKAGSSSHPSYEVQSLDIEVDDDTFKGMPFVILCDLLTAMGLSIGLLTVGSPIYSLRNILAFSKQRRKFLRFNIASNLISEAINAGQPGPCRVVGVDEIHGYKTAHMEQKLQLLIIDWNSEISKAHDRLTDLLQDVYASYPQYKEIVRMILSTIGRGGEGDVGREDSG